MINLMAWVRKVAIERRLRNQILETGALLEVLVSADAWWKAQGKQSYITTEVKRQVSLYLNAALDKEKARAAQIIRDI